MSQRYRILIGNQAEADLYGIYRYIADVLLEKQIAAKVYQRIKAAILDLDHMPERIKLMDDEPWHSRGLRLLVTGNYKAIFLIDGDAVHVLRVMYGGMDIDKQLSD